jgi:hypothetical protein
MREKFLPLKEAKKYIFTKSFGHIQKSKVLECVYPKKQFYSNQRKESLGKNLLRNNFQ